MEEHSKKIIFDQLQKEILLLEGFKPILSDKKSEMGLGDIEAVFPNGIFPKAAIHEFLALTPELAAAGTGFISGLLQSLMRHSGPCIWISTSRTVFPPALKTFGIEPDRVIFIDLQKEKDILWVMEEALKCESLSAVVAEVREVSLTASRRLQLAVEKSGVTGMLLRNDPGSLSTTASVARWQIKPIKSKLEGEMPGVGFPRWRVELLKVRNGNPGAWNVEWSGNHFNIISEDNNPTAVNDYKQQVG